MCQGLFNSVSGSFKEVSRKFHGCLKELKREFEVVGSILESKEGGS